MSNEWPVQDYQEWIEGEFLALESLHQEEEDWIFPRPPLAFAIDDSGPPSHQSWAKLGPRTQSSSEPTRPPKTQIFVD